MRPRVGRGHAGTGAVAVPSTLHEPVAVLYRDTFVCMNHMSIKTTSKYMIYRLLEHVFEPCHRPSTTRTGLQASPVDVLRYHLARGNHFTAGRTFASLSLTLNQFEFVVGYRLSTQSFLRACSHVVM